MNKFMPAIILLLLLTLSFGCAAGKVGNDTPLERLKAEVDHLIADPAFASASWGVYIEAPDTREVL